MFVLDANDQIMQFQIGAFEIIVDDRMVEQQSMMTFNRATLSKNLSVILLGQLFTSIEFQTFHTFERGSSDADHVGIQIALIECPDSIGIQIQDADLPSVLYYLANIVDRGAVEIAIVLTEFHEGMSGDFRQERLFRDEMIIDVGNLLSTSRARGMRHGDVEEIRCRLEKTPTQFMSPDIRCS